MEKIKELPIVAIIGEGCSIKGDLQVEGSARIDGCVEGDIKATGSLIVGENGEIAGDVQAVCYISGGKHRGDVYAYEKVELTDTAEVNGDIYTKIIVIDEKAIFQGKCNMNLSEDQINREIDKS